MSRSHKKTKSKICLTSSSSNKKCGGKVLITRGGKRSYRRSRSMKKRTAGLKRSNHSIKRSNRSHGGYTKKKSMKMYKRKMAESRLAEALTGTTDKKCPTGKVVRRGYITKKGAVVGAECIKDLGKPGKYSPKKGTAPIYLKEGAMSKFGYHDLKNKTVKQRHDSLRKAIAAVGYDKVMKRVNVLQVLDKSTDRKIAKIAKADVDWMKKHRASLRKL